MQSAKCSCSRFRGCGRNGKLKNNIQTTGKAIQLRLHGIRFLSEHLDLLEHRATTSAGKPVSIVRVSICNRMRPSRIKDKFSRVFSKFSQNCPSRVATRAICENFENTSENLSLILRGLNAITCL